MLADRWLRRGVRAWKDVQWGVRSRALRDRLWAHGMLKAPAYFRLLDQLHELDGKLPRFLRGKAEGPAVRQGKRNQDAIQAVFGCLERSVHPVRIYFRHLQFSCVVMRDDASAPRPAEMFAGNEMSR